MRPLRVTALLLALSGLAACGGQTKLPEDLQRDLEQASTSGVDLAPRAPRTAVVSAIELGQAESKAASVPQTTPQRRAPERAKAPQQTQRAPVRQVAAVTPRPEPQPVPVAETPAPVAEAPAPVVETPAPSPTIEVPAPQPMPSRMPSRAPSRGGRGGGWWSTGDVIRNAPFPINP